MNNSYHKNVLEMFLEELRQMGRKPRSIKNYNTRLPRFFQFLEEKGYSFQLTPGEAQEYQGWIMEGKNYSTRTVACYVGPLTSFYDFLKRKGIVATNPFREIKKIRVDKKLPENILKPKEMIKLLDALERYDEEKNLKRRITTYRVHVIAELMYSSGLRISEVADLKTTDVDLARGIITVTEGKGGSSRIAWLNDYAKEVLTLYITRARKEIFTAWHWRNAHLLFGTKWSRLERPVNNCLKEKAAALGLPPVTSHGFRHALGFHLLKAGCPIRYIQSILGHKKLRNTEIYTKVEKEDLKNILDTYHPRGDFKKLHRRKP